MSVIVRRSLTQSVNYGSVTLTQNQATQILPANANRVKLYLQVGGGGTTVHLGTDSSVTTSNGFLAAGAGYAVDGSGKPVLTESGLDWQTAVYGYTTLSGVTVSYLEEVLS